MKSKTIPSLQASQVPIDFPDRPHRKGDSQLEVDSETQHHLRAIVTACKIDPIPGGGSIKRRAGSFLTASGQLRTPRFIHCRHGIFELSGFGRRLELNNARHLVAA